MGGAPYGAALRLLAIAQEHWAVIDGAAAANGVDLIDLAPDRFFNHIQWWALQRVKDPERFLRDLERPVPGIDVVGSTVTEADLEEDAAAFVAFAGAFGVTPPGAVSEPKDVIDVPSEPA